MNIEAILFDMDGVMIDSKLIWRRIQENDAA